jgi:hypothetical protein
MSLEDIQKRLERLENLILQINGELGVIKGKMDTTSTLVKWVIFPMLMILAGLVGVKLVMPG